MMNRYERHKEVGKLHDENHKVVIDNIEAREKFKREVGLAFEEYKVGDLDEAMKIVETEIFADLRNFENLNSL